MDDILDKLYPDKEESEPSSVALPSPPKVGDLLDQLYPDEDALHTRAVKLAATGADIISQTMAGAAETLGSLATGLASMPASGLAMIAGLVAKRDVNKAIEWGEAVNDYLIYKPSSRYGKIYTEAANTLLGLPAEGIRAGMSYLVEEGGTPPIVAAALGTPLEFATYALLFKGAKGAFPKGIDVTKISPADLLKAEQNVTEFYSQKGMELLRDEPITGEASKASMPKPLKTELRPGEEPPVVRNPAEEAKLVEQKSAEAALDDAFARIQKNVPLIRREPVIGEKAPKPRTPVDLLKSEEGAIDLESLKKVGRSFKEFWSPFSTVPGKNEVLLERYRSIGSIDRAETFIKEIYDKLGEFPLQTRSDIFKYLDGQTTLDSIPIEAQRYAQSIQERTKTIGRMLVKRDIISQETFDNLKGRYVHYLYTKHILGDDASIGISPTGKLNLDYAKHRKDITYDERLSLGLIEDAQLAVPTGMGKALTDIAKHDYMDYLSKNPDVTWQPSIIDVSIRPNQPPTKMGIGQLVDEVATYEKMVRDLSSPEVDARYNTLKQALDTATQQAVKAPEDFIQLPTSKTYGPLSGAFVRKPVANDLMPLMNSMKDRGHLVETLVNIEEQGMALYKMGKVALNLPTATRNVISNILQNNMRGRTLIDIPDDMIKAGQSMLNKDNFYKEAKKNGVFKTNWSVTEIKEILNEFSHAKTEGTYSHIVDAVKNLAKYYGRIDDVNKFSIFRQLRSEGNPLEVSVLEAQKWGMDYSLASRSIKHLRQWIIPFATYDYKIAPLIAESLSKRPWVIGKFVALPLLAKTVTMGMNDMTEDDWDKLQKQLPNYIKTSKSFMIMPYKSESGNYQWMSYAYFFPWGNYLNIYEGLEQRDLSRITNATGISNPWLDILTTFKSSKGDDPPRQPFTTAPLYNRLDPPHVKAAKVVESLANTFIPPMLTRGGALGYTYSAAVEGEDKWGKEISTGQAIGRWFGVNITEVSPKQSIVMKHAMEKTIRTELYKILSDPKKSTEEKADAKERAREAIRKIYK